MAKTLKPYREAVLSPIMAKMIAIGSVLFAIIMFIVMQVPSLA